MGGPEHLVAIALILAGLAGLVAGASLLVRGASHLARGMGVSKLVVGLTVVAFGTSTPELAASLNAALADHAGLAVGNVVGSNILNVLLILGAAAAISPLGVASRLVRTDIPLMIAASAGVWLLAFDGVLGRVDAGILVLAFAAYVLLQFRLGTKADTASATHAPESRKEESPLPGGRAGAAGAVAAGLLLLTLGSGWLVTGSMDIATGFGLSEQVIGLTIVALGTSLPELATSVTAALKKELDIAVGNVVGSNLFNLLAVLGCAGLVSGAGLSVPGELSALDIPAMTAAAVMLLPICISGARISRAEGILLLGLYIAYLFLQGLQISGRPVPTVLAQIGRYGVLPATAAFLFYSQLKSLRQLSGLLNNFEEHLGEAFATSVRTTRKIVILMAGGSVLAVGIAMVVLPGPAVLVIPLGLAILGTEFAWAKSLLLRLQTEIRKRLPKGLQQSMPWAKQKNRQGGGTTPV